MTLENKIKTAFAAFIGGLMGFGVAIWMTKPVFQSKAEMIFLSHGKLEDGSFAQYTENEDPKALRDAANDQMLANWQASGNAALHGSAPLEVEKWSAYPKNTKFKTFMMKYGVMISTTKKMSTDDILSQQVNKNLKIKMFFPNTLMIEARADNFCGL